MNNKTRDGDDRIALMTNLPADVDSETFEALLALGHGEARKLIDAALENNKKKFKDTTELLQVIYTNRSAGNDG